MAKRVVATLQKAGVRNFAKVVRCMRSPKTGAYTFREEMVPTEEVKRALAREA
jgi:hypothetical protein